MSPSAVSLLLAPSRRTFVFPTYAKGVESPGELLAPLLFRLRTGPRCQQMWDDPQALGWALGYRVVFISRALSSFVGQGFPESFELSDLGEAVETLWACGACLNGTCARNYSSPHTEGDRSH